MLETARIQISKTLLPATDAPGSNQPSQAAFVNVNVQDIGANSQGRLADPAAAREIMNEIVRVFGPGGMWVLVKRAVQSECTRPA